MREIITDLTNGKSSGSAGIKAELNKYGTSLLMIKLLAVVFEKMIKFNITPYLFNVGIVKPIVKDSTKDCNDPKNLRPITISDCAANIYEKILLSELDKTHTNHPKQFGFKKKQFVQPYYFYFKRVPHVQQVKQ